MKTIFWSALLLIGLIGLLLWLGRFKETPQPSIGRVDQFAEQQGKTEQSPMAGQTPEEKALDALGLDEDGKKRMLLLHKKGVEGNRPIRFYGKVVDQNQDPVGGAKIVVSLRAYDEENLEKIAEGRKDEITEDTLLELRSDANGLFSISDRKGTSLSFKSIEKEGYGDAAYPEVYYKYDPWLGDTHHPDSQKPVIFQLWKQQGAEPLIYRKFDTRIPYDGTPVLVDLEKGKLVQSGGDIRVTLARTPIKIKWGQKNYEWKAQIDAVEGGLIHATNALPYLAPENGYEPGVEIQMPANDPNWRPEIKVPLYLKSRGGKNYGRLILEFRTGSDQPTTGFAVESYLNPASSRNLEYDPAKRINKQ